jgi:3-oxoacyl-[acyl-carrier protein] reductase
MEFLSQVALVVGGGRGIGRATALALAQKGADVAVSARTLAEIEQVAADIESLGRRGEAVRCDVANEQSVNAMVSDVLSIYMGIDILVFCAGVIDFGLLSGVRSEMWDRIMTINLRGAFLTVRAVLPSMRQQGEYRARIFYRRTCGRGDRANLSGI